MSFAPDCARAHAHASHGWRDRRCVHCGALASWPIASDPCRASASDSVMAKAVRVDSMARDGKRPRQIADEIGAHVETVRRWIRLARRVSE